MSLTSLRWVAGIFCGCVGALMLVVPHRFFGPVFNLFRAELAPIAVAFLVSGTALAAATAFAPNEMLLAMLHALIGLAFLLLAAGFIAAGSWAGCVRFLVFGFGTLAAPWFARLWRKQRTPIDLFEVLLAIATATTGVILVVAIGTSAGAVQRSPLVLAGVSFCLAGGLLGGIQLATRRSAALVWAARFLVAASFIAFIAVTPLQSQSWLGVSYYAGFGAALILGPLLASRLASDPASLGAQLGVAVMLATAVPLVTIVTIICNRQQDMVTAQTLRSAQTLAAVLADDVAGFAQTNREIVTAIANTPDLAGMTARQRAELLREYQRLHPNVFAISMYDSRGQSLARGDDLPPVNRVGEPVLENARRSNTPSFETIIGRNSGVPTFIFGAPIQGPDREFAGIATISVPAERWLELLKRASGRDSVYLVGNDGRVLAYPDAVLNSAFADFSMRPSVRALLDRPGSSGSLDYNDNHSRMFAGYARVPEIGGVIVEQPADVALAMVYAGREVTLKTLLGMVALAGILGLVVARSLAAPLTEMARAAQHLASGNATSPLPRSRITELRHLATIFGTMRETLQQQTQERERAEKANQELLVREAEARAETQALQELNQFKDDLLDNVAHELRTPLTSIRAYSELLLTYEDSEPATQREFMQIINAESERLTRLLNDVLDLTKIQSGGLQWEMRQLELGVLLQESARKHSVLIRRQGLNFEVDIAKDLPPVIGDSDRLMQVVDNLLSNATKFTRAGEITLRAWQADSEVCISVADTGTGIPVEEQSRVFDKFHQVTSGLTDKPTGTGLGLAICKEIVDHHQGRLWVESEPGKGSTFSFALLACDVTIAATNVYD